MITELWNHPSSEASKSEVRDKKGEKKGTAKAKEKKRESSTRRAIEQKLKKKRGEVDMQREGETLVAKGRPNLRWDRLKQSHKKTH